VTDVLTKEQRSYNMSRIKGKNTKPELTVRKLLSSKGIRGYRTHYKIIGKPDIVFPSKKIVIFIDGCFWHKCPKCFVEPKTRREFWMNKINENVKRDKEVNKILKEDGWKVLRFWEHEVKTMPEKVINTIIKELSY